MPIKDTRGCPFFDTLYILFSKPSMQILLCSYHETPCSFLSVKKRVPVKKKKTQHAEVSLGQELPVEDRLSKAQQSPPHPSTLSLSEACVTSAAARHAAMGREPAHRNMNSPRVPALAREDLDEEWNLLQPGNSTHVLPFKGLKSNLCRLFFPGQLCF